jgi:protein-S-isoprenylcysteine O-methyltransferase
VQELQKWVDWSLDIKRLLRAMSVSLLLGLVYLISELLLTVTRRSRSPTGTKQDRSTLRVVWLVIVVSVAAGIYVAKQLPAAALPHCRSFVFAGVVFFVAGLLLRWWAIITLGRFFTVDVTIEKDHELVERGPFRVVRHPSYTGVLLAFVGLGLSLGNWVALLVIILPIGRGVHSPYECGGECLVGRAWLAIHRLHAAGAPNG